MTPKPTPRTLAHRATHYHKRVFDNPIRLDIQLRTIAAAAGVKVSPVIVTALAFALAHQREWLDSLDSDGLKLLYQPTPLDHYPPQARAAMTAEFEKVTK